MKTIIVILATVLSSQFAAAEIAPTAGSARLRVSGVRFDSGYDVQRAGSQLRGITFNQGHSLVDLTLGERGWSGRFGDLFISRTKVTELGRGRIEVEIVTLPQGFFTYTVTRNRKGDLQISGMGPRGHLNRGSLKADGSQLSAGSGFGQDLNLRRDRRKNHLFDGTVIANSRFGRMDTDFASLVVRDGLDPMILSNDLALYTILYVLPFSR